MYIEEVRQFETLRFLWFIWEICRLHNGSIISGCRTERRNVEVGGAELSKHTFKGGWGLAVDIWFDSPLDRTVAVNETLRHGYFPYIGGDYASQRLHIQAYKKGFVPKEIPNVQV